MKIVNIINIKSYNRLIYLGRYSKIYYIFGKINKKQLIIWYILVKVLFFYSGGKCFLGIQVEIKLFVRKFNWRQSFMVYCFYSIYEVFCDNSLFYQNIME